MVKGSHGSELAAERPVLLLRMEGGYGLYFCLSMLYDLLSVVNIEDFRVLYIAYTCM